MAAHALASAAAWLCLLASGWRLATPGLPEPLRLALAWLAIVTALLALAAAVRHRGRLAVAAVLAAAALLGAARAPSPPPPRPAEALPIALEAVLLAWHEPRPGLLRAEIRLAAADARRWGVARAWRAEGRWEGSPEPRVGQRLRVEGLWNGDCTRPWLSLARLLPAAGTECHPLAALRQSLRDRLDERLPPRHAGLARALLLADWQALAPPLRESYRRLGLLHLLAVSGLHFWVWNELLRRLAPGRRRLPRWLALTTLAALAGGGPAVVRALVALWLREISALSARTVSGLRLWSAALLVECALGAPERQGLGFVLSYAATGCLLAAPPVATDRAWARTLHASAAASCGSAPVLHALRGTIEPWSVLASPLCGLALAPRLLLSVLALLPFGAAPAAVAFDAIAATEDALLEQLDRLPGTPWARTELSATRVLAACAVALSSLIARARGRARLAAGAVLLAALLLAAPAARDGEAPGLLLLPVGHGLGAVLRGATGTLLYDLGSRGCDPAELLDRRVLPELARRAWPAPRLAVLSHADADHAAALELLAARDGMSRLRVEPGAEVRLQGFAPFSLRVIGTRPATTASSNAGGPVLEAAWKPAAGEARRAVVLGDQFGHSLRELRGRLAPGPIDVLVLPHHGLTTDGLGELLDHLRPREAWASCGLEDLPLPAAPLCARRGIPLRTTADGALRWPEIGSSPETAGASNP